VNSLKVDNSWLGGITDNTIYYHATDHLKQALDILRNDKDMKKMKRRCFILKQSREDHSSGFL
jgi:hypothetical protein